MRHPVRDGLPESELADLKRRAERAETMVDKQSRVGSDMQAEIARLRAAIMERDEAASAGLGTMDFCGYCGAAGKTNPAPDEGHRTPCPIETHPLDPNDPGIPDSSEA